MIVGAFCSIVANSNIINWTTWGRSCVIDARTAEPTCTTVVAIVDADSPMTRTTSMSPSATAVTMVGIRPIIPLITSVNAPIPATPEAARAVKPVASIVTPAPQANAPTPNKAIAPERPMIAGTTGARRSPAAPITANAPPSTISPFPIASQLIPPASLRTGTRIAKAPAATNKAADPARVPFIRLSAMDSSANAPPKARRPIASCSQLIPDKLVRVLPRTEIAAAAANIPMLFPTMSLGRRFIAIEISSSTAPIPDKPLTSWSTLRLPIFSTALPNISIAAASAIIPTDVDMMPFVPEFRFVNIDNSSNTAPTPARPWIILLVSISANLPTALASMFTA